MCFLLLANRGANLARMTRPFVLLLVLTVAAVLFTLALVTPAQSDGGEFEGSFYYEGEPDNVEEYTLHGLKWNKACLTYRTTDAPVEGIYGNAFALWAAQANISNCGPVASGEDIFFARGTLPSGTAGQAAWSGGSNGISRCTITVAPGAAGNLAVWAHEIGHCLGLGHSAIPTALMAPLCCNPVHADDIAGIRALYGTNPNAPTPTPPPTFTATATPTATPTPTRTPTPPSGCASSWRMLPNGEVIVQVTCSPFRFVVPGLAAGG